MGKNARTQPQEKVFKNKKFRSQSLGDAMYKDKPNYKFASKFSDSESANIHSFFEICLKQGFPGHYSNTRVPPQLRAALVGKDLLWFTKIGINQVHDLIKNLEGNRNIMHLCKMNTRSVRRMHLWTIIYPLYILYRFPNIRIKVNIANHNSIPEYSNWLLEKNAEFRNKFFKFKVRKRDFSPNYDFAREEKEDCWYRLLSHEGKKGVIHYTCFKKILDEQIEDFNNLDKDYDILIIDDRGFKESAFWEPLEARVPKDRYTVQRQNSVSQNNYGHSVLSFAKPKNIVVDDDDHITNFDNIVSHNTMSYTPHLVSFLQKNNKEIMLQCINDCLLDGCRLSLGRVKQILIFYDTKRARPQLFVEPSEVEKCGLDLKYNDMFREEIGLVRATFKNNKIHYDIKNFANHKEYIVDDETKEWCSCQRQDVNLELAKAHWTDAWLEIAGSHISAQHYLWDLDRKIQDIEDPKDRLEDLSFFEQLVGSGTTERADEIIALWQKNSAERQACKDAQRKNRDTDVKDEDKDAEIKMKIKMKIKKMIVRVRKKIRNVKRNQMLIKDEGEYEDDCDYGDEDEDENDGNDDENHKKDEQTKNDQDDKKDEQKK